MPFHYTSTPLRAGLIAVCVCVCSKSMYGLCIWAFIKKSCKTQAWIHKTRVKENISDIYYDTINLLYVIKLLLTDEYVICSCFVVNILDIASTSSVDTAITQLPGALRPIITRSWARLGCDLSRGRGGPWRKTVQARTPDWCHAPSDPWASWSCEVHGGH